MFTLIYAKNLKLGKRGVTFLILGIMSCRAVVVWRNVKYSTSAWKGRGKNTHGQSEEAEVRILMISLLRWSFKVKVIVGCMHLKVEVEKGQLEMELNSPGMVRIWRPWVLRCSCEKGNYS